MGTIIELALIGVGLAMDAFAVAICKGTDYRAVFWRVSGSYALYRLDTGQAV